MHHKVLSGAEWRCVAFVQYFMSDDLPALLPGRSFTVASSFSLSTRADSSIRGVICYPMIDPRASKIEEDAGELFRQVRLRTEATTTFRRLDPAAFTLSAIDPRTRLPGWSAAPGTRFVTRTGGFFQVVRYEGDVAIMFNSAGQTTRWSGGLLVNRTSQGVDGDALAGLLPLHVGNQVEVFERSYNNDGWRYTVTVTGKETMTVKGKSYDVFVIAVRERTVNADQGGIARNLTFGFSPEAGGHLRLRGDSLAGWDVVDIVVPQ